MSTPTTEQRFTALGDESFVSLTTHRRSGEPVATAVWVARDGDALVVVTPAHSAKVKRVRNDPRVELVPCDRAGRVRAGAEPVAGSAEVLTGADAAPGAELVRRQYRFEHRVVRFVERVVRRREVERVVLRIVPRTAQG
ncbi:PPOX class F420-dependent oxidoreductase [Kineococcus indalonis]|uniref:PPOX class F420-dependent oxidoreductase n=1 Tax=Kineococcus indalonis TaxID=2696566 RepID=UPI001413007A|nr:PPOX class F420-dependent oxidoreductase [Kineococcus indalonis]NAZ85286.1 PPOX class F420-dependent oxidoreductase [Kineococcus indalonis]